jgi:hypothetical protein
VFPGKRLGWLLRAYLTATGGGGQQRAGSAQQHARNRSSEEQQAAGSRQAAAQAARNATAAASGPSQSQGSQQQPPCTRSSTTRTSRRIPPGCTCVYRYIVPRTVPVLLDLVDLLESSSLVVDLYGTAVHSCSTGTVYHCTGIVGCAVASQQHQQSAAGRTASSSRTPECDSPGAVRLLMCEWSALLLQAAAFRSLHS